MTQTPPNLNGLSIWSQRQRADGVGLLIHVEYCYAHNLTHGLYPFFFFFSSPRKYTEVQSCVRLGGDAPTWFDPSMPQNSDKHIMAFCLYYEWTTTTMTVGVGVGTIQILLYQIVQRIIYCLSCL